MQEPQLHPQPEQAQPQVHSKPQSPQTMIPLKLSTLLKQFTKDAIRAQPEDILEWSAQYFTALVQGEELPVFEPEETDLIPTNKELTPDVLRAMHQQLHEKETVKKENVVQVWRSFGLDVNLLMHLLKVGCFGDELEWIKFFALGCSHLGGGTIMNAMVQALYILNLDSSVKPPDACVPFETFRVLYTYLTDIDGEVSEAQIKSVLSYLSKATDGLVKISDLSNTNVFLGRAN